MDEIGARRATKLPVCNVFHAGDGKPHHLLIFEVRNRAIWKRPKLRRRYPRSFAVQGGGARVGRAMASAWKKRDLMTDMFASRRLDQQTSNQMRVRSAAPCFNTGTVFPRVRPVSNKAMFMYGTAPAFPGHAGF